MLFTFLGKVLGDQSRIFFSDRVINITSREGEFFDIELDDIVDFPVVRHGFFLLRITFPLKGNVQKTFKFSRLTSVYQEYTVGMLNFDLIGETIGNQIENGELLYRTLAEKEYLRDSSIDILADTIEPLLARFQASKPLWMRHVPPSQTQWILDYQDEFPITLNASRIRERFEIERLALRASFFDNIESNPLTKEQRNAVVRENDRNLVLAAAGTGKTSVMVAKALDLISSKQLIPSEILVLAYNNAAAKELRERVAKRAKQAGLEAFDNPNIATFHALGKSILKASNISTYISVLAEDTAKFDKWVHDWLVDYISSSPKAMKDFITIQYHPADPFQFTSKEQYERFIRDNEYRALSGDLVRGYQELLIANWLYQNGIEFEYEARYVTKIRVDIGYDYKPDFYISGTDIYIEHFGIDRLGNTRPDIDADLYRKGMVSKRQLHESQGTRLIETFHYDWCEDCLEISLEKQLIEHGVTPRPISNDQLFVALNESGVIDSGAKILQKSLKAIRVENLDNDEIFNRLEKAKVPFYERHATLIGALHDAYKDRLKSENTIDFDDMILRATECVSKGNFKPQWKFILVDEFQDISNARMNFLNQLITHGQNPKLTVVGDDWQSIYRFSGGKLELTTRFSKLVGSNTLSKLEKTFRYNNSIADTAGTFIMENDEQYKKHIETHDVVNSSQIYLLDSKVGQEKNDMAQKTVQIIEKIASHDAGASIAVLSRYNYLLKDAKETVNNSKINLNIKYWTFHGSKGLEADYCILIGFSQGKIGFPNENKDDSVVEALLPTLDSFPHSEERRLMYVALTRAKKKVYLIADPTAPSQFVSELMAPKYDLMIGSKAFQKEYRKIFKCPSCVEGYFKKLKGPFGEFYVCTSGKACRIKPRVCKVCSAPSVDTESDNVCQNVRCGHKEKICPRCARPMKVRKGPFKEFYGCTGYGLTEDRCTKTVNI